MLLSTGVGNIPMGTGHATIWEAVRLVVYTKVDKEKMFAGVCKLYIRKRIHCKHNDKSGIRSSDIT